MKTLIERMADALKEARDIYLEGCFGREDDKFRSTLDSLIIEARLEGPPVNKVIGEEELVEELRKHLRHQLLIAPGRTSTDGTPIDLLKGILRILESR